MNSKIDKELERKRKTRDGDTEDKIERIKAWWKIFIVSPSTYFVSIIGTSIFSCFGMY